MGLGEVGGLVIPKPMLIAAPERGGTIAARYFMPHAAHKALAVTGAVGLATACATPGTIAARLAPGTGVDAPVRIEHPSGCLELTLSRRRQDGPLEASILRTARKIFEGQVFVRTPDGDAAGATPV